MNLFPGRHTGYCGSACADSLLRLLFSGASDIGVPGRTPYRLPVHIYNLPSLHERHVRSDGRCDHFFDDRLIKNLNREQKEPDARSPPR